MDLEVLYLLPFIAAFIGWLTNYIAVKMLFRPKKPWRLFFFSIQGVFPKRQAAFAKKLGHVVASELFSAEDVKIALLKAADSGAFNHIVKREIERVVTQKLPQVFPMLQMILTPELTQKVAETFEAEIGVLISAMADSIGTDLEDALNVEAVVEEKVNQFSSEKLEDMLFAIMKREFKFIELVGAILGFFIGVVQICLLKWQVLYEIFRNLV